MEKRPKLFSPSQVCVGSFLGTSVIGIIFITINYFFLKKNRLAWIVAIAGIAALSLYFFVLAPLLNWIPDIFHGLATTLGACYAGFVLMKDECEAAMVKGIGFQSYLTVIGACVLVWISIFVYVLFQPM